MFLTKVVGTSQIECKCISGMDKTLRRFFCQCLAREDVACDVDEVMMLWSDPAARSCRSIFLADFFPADVLDFFFQFGIFCEHIFVPSNANVSAMHMLHVFGEKISKK